MTENFYIIVRTASLRPEFVTPLYAGTNGMIEHGFPSLKSEVL